MYNLRCTRNDGVEERRCARQEGVRKERGGAPRRWGCALLSCNSTFAQLRLAGQSPRPRLHPEPRVPPVQDLYQARAGPLGGVFEPATAVEEQAPESQHGLPALPVDSCADGKQAVRVSRAGVPRGVSAAHHYLRRGFLNHLEMVGELGAWLIRRS